MDPTTPSPSATVRQAATALAVLVVVGLVSAVGLSALVGTSSAAGGGSGAPPLPPDDAVLGVLGIDGEPLVDLDGQPLQLPLQVTDPQPPDNPDDSVPYDGLPPTADLEEVPILDAYARTLESAAEEQGLGLVATFDLFRLNRIVADDARSAAFRELLVTLTDHEARGDIAAACQVRTGAAAAVAGSPTGTVSGIGIAPLSRALAERGAELGC